MPIPQLGDFASVAARAAVRLRDLADGVEGVRPECTERLSFALSDLSETEIMRRLLRAVRAFARKGVPAIYIFRLANAAHYDLLRQAFALRPDPRQRGVGKCYSRLSNEWPPRSIYVGSSWDLPGRISQHVGQSGGDGTYSMRLKLWAAHVDDHVDLTLCRFSGQLNPIEVEAIEQQIWDELRPMLGKRSGR